jgi:hypothetical protein
MGSAAYDVSFEIIVEGEQGGKKEKKRYRKMNEEVKEVKQENRIRRTESDRSIEAIVGRSDVVPAPPSNEAATTASTRRMLEG